MNKSDRPTVSVKTEQHPACERCHFFSRDMSPSPQPTGRCHRYPRRALGTNVAAFPQHMLLDWCGEFKQR